MGILLEFVLKYKFALLAVLMVAGLYMWHVSEVSRAESAMKSARDTYWTEYIKNAPHVRDTTFLTTFIPLKDTSGVSAAVARADKASRAKIDSLLRTVTNKDSMLVALSTPQATTIRDTAVGKLDVTYTPLNTPLTKFSWTLTDRPPARIDKQIIIDKQIVPLPFRHFAIGADVDWNGDCFVGARYRITEFIMTGVSYKVLGQSKSVRIDANVFAF